MDLDEYCPISTSLRVSTVVVAGLSGYYFPHEYAVVVPARQAYSHSASVGKAYSQPAGYYLIPVNSICSRNISISS